MRARKRAYLDRGIGGWLDPATSFPNRTPRDLIARIEAFSIAEQRVWDHGAPTMP